MRHLPFLAAALLAAAPLAAQQPAARDTTRHRMMGGHMAAPRMGGMHGAGGGAMGCAAMAGGMMHDSAMGGMMDAMMWDMALAPDRLLARKTALGLTADQERRLTALRDAAGASHDAAMRTALRHQQELDEVMRTAAPDTAAVAMHFNAAHGAMGEAHLAMLRAAALARAVLTDAQRQRADSAAATMGCRAMGAPAARPPARRR